MLINDEYENNNNSNNNLVKKSYILLYENDPDNKVVKLCLSDNNNKINIDEFILYPKYSFEESLKILVNNLLGYETCDDNEDKKKKEIGINDKEFILFMEIINRMNLNKNKNIILKAFNFYPNGSLDDDYFTLNKPNFNQFLDDLGIDELTCKNKIIIVPLNVGCHISLLLIYNNRMFIIDFGLHHIIDDNIVNMKSEINSLDDKISEFLIEKKYTHTQIWSIIDKYENTLDIKNKLQKIIKEEHKDYLLDLIDKYKIISTKLRDVKFLINNPRIDPDIFKNNSFDKNIEVLNFYNIQGFQACGYFCLAAIKLLTSKEYFLNDILKLIEDSTFHIEILKILCDEFLGDPQEIFKINEDIDKKEYKIYIKNHNKIGIRKKINDFNIKTREDKNYLSLSKEYFFYSESIHKMLINKGYTCE